MKRFRKAIVFVGLSLMLVVGASQFGRLQTASQANLNFAPLVKLVSRFRLHSTATPRRISTPPMAWTPCMLKAPLARVKPS
jgi:hypothetical protein